MWVVVFVYIFLTTNFSGNNDRLTVYRLVQQRKTATATATVTRLDRQNHNGCDYAYSVGSHRYEGSEEGCAQNHHVGDTLPVFYLLAKPSASTPTPPRELLRTGVLFSAIAPSILALFAGFGTARRNRRRATP